MRPGIDKAEHDQRWKKAQLGNMAAIIIVILSIVAFSLGIILTGVALPKLEPLVK